MTNKTIKAIFLGTPLIERMSMLSEYVINCLTLNPKVCSAANKTNQINVLNHIKYSGLIALLEERKNKQKKNVQKNIFELDSQNN